MDVRRAENSFAQKSEELPFSFLSFSLSRSSEMCVYTFGARSLSWTRKSDCLPFPSAPYGEIAAYCNDYSFANDELAGCEVEWLSVKRHGFFADFFRCSSDGIEIEYRPCLFFFASDSASSVSVLIRDLRGLSVPSEEQRPEIWNPGFRVDRRRPNRYHRRVFRYEHASRMFF